MLRLEGPSAAPTQPGDKGTHYSTDANERPQQPRVAPQPTADCRAPGTAATAPHRQPGLSPGTSLQSGDRDAQSQLTPSPTRAGKSQRTCLGPGPAQPSSVTSEQSGAAPGLGGLTPLAQSPAVPCPAVPTAGRAAGPSAQPSTHRPCVRGSRGAGPLPRTTAAAGSLPTSSWLSAGSPPRSAPADGEGWVRPAAWGRGSGATGAVGMRLSQRWGCLERNRAVMPA